LCGDRRRLRSDGRRRPRPPAPRPRRVARVARRFHAAAAIAAGEFSCASGRRLMNPLHDVIAEFADGEAVDPNALKQALAEAEGRDHLIDVLVLRGMIGAPMAASMRMAQIPGSKDPGLLRSPG